MPDVQEIIDGLRANALVGDEHLVHLVDAVAAVHAAADAATETRIGEEAAAYKLGKVEGADARTQETDRLLRSDDLLGQVTRFVGDRYSREIATALHAAADDLARRFPNGGTPGE